MAKTMVTSHVLNLQRKTALACRCYSSAVFQAFLQVSVGDAAGKQNRIILGRQRRHRNKELGNKLYLSSAPNRG